MGGEGFAVGAHQGTGVMFGERERVETVFDFFVVGENWSFVVRV